MKTTNNGSIAALAYLDIGEQGDLGLDRGRVLTEHTGFGFERSHVDQTSDRSENSSGADYLLCRLVDHCSSHCASFSKS